MATYWPTVHQISRGVIEARWVATSFVASTDVVQPVDLSGYPDRTVVAQMVATAAWDSATMKFYGSNQPTITTGPMTVTVATGVPLVDPNGTAITFAADGTETFLEASRWVYWTCTSKATASDNSAITVRILASQKRA